MNQNFTYFENKFSTTSGHDHDGIDSVSVLKGTWQGTVVDEVYGGTGQNVYASGDLLWATSDQVLARLALGTLGSILIADVIDGEPEWLAPGNENQNLFVDYNNNPVWGDLVKLGTFTRDTALAASLQKITGVGFKPFAVIFMGVQDSGSEMSLGFDTGSAQYVIIDGHEASADTWTLDATDSIYDQEGANSYHGNIIALDEDGFTITWTKGDNPTGVFTVYYMAFR